MKARNYVIKKNMELEKQRIAELNRLKVLKREKVKSLFGWKIT